MRKNTSLYLAERIFLVMAVLAFSSVISARASNQEPVPELEIKYQNLEKLLEQVRTLNPPPGSDLPPDLDQAWHKLVDFKVLGEKVMSRNRGKFSSRQQTLILEALETAIKQDALHRYKSARSQGRMTRQVVNEKKKGDKTQITYNLQWGEQIQRIKVFAQKDPAGAWKIIDIESSKDKLSESFRKRIHRLQKEYSFPGLLAELRGDNVIVIDDFSSEVTGSMPRGWRWQEKDNDEKKFILVKAEGENKYINLIGRGHSVIFGKVFKWNLAEFPYISWKWRIHALPEGGDERFNETNDSAAAVYIIYSKNLVGVPKVVKYVWSTTLPQGAATQRKGIGRPWSVVAKSGEQGMGIWHTEVFDAVAAFRETFGKNPPKNPIGLAILTDANSTKSYSEADYDDFKLLRQAEAGSGVKQKLKGGK